jgi:deazaflavin-dependent oxidoreductase (nitroreductase family)
MGGPFRDIFLRTAGEWPVSMVMMSVTHAIDRWFYRGGRPNRPARVLNRAWAAIYSAGVWPSRLATLEVRGRRSGRVIAFPVVIAEVEGERYVVAMLGEDTNWVRNLRAADGRAVLRHGRTEAVRLQEVEPDARAPILRRYLACAPGARAHIPVDRRAPLEELQPIAVHIPVFRITSELELGVPTT